jgi:hypothetical protein
MFLSSLAHSCVFLSSLACFCLTSPIGACSCLPWSKAECSYPLSPRAAYICYPRPQPPVPVLSCLQPTALLPASLELSHLCYCPSSLKTCSCLPSPMAACFSPHSPKAAFSYPFSPRAGYSCHPQPQPTALLPASLDHSHLI